MLAQTVTKGQAPSLSVNVDPATNRITTGGYSYDSNGNLTAMPLLAMSYNVDNRLAQATSSLNGTDQFVYDPQGRRVWKSENGSWKVYFYGVDGNLLGVYGGPSYGDYNIYFGRKLIYTQSYPAGPVVEDRLASTVKHFPYGEEPSTTNQNRTKFATYYRDATTALDYARNRYYSRTIGRFTSPDPYTASGGPADPQSWNRYAYVQNDPVNFNDPSGLMMGWANFFALDGLGASSPGGGGYAPCLVDGIYTDCAWAQRMPNAVETGLPSVVATENGLGTVKTDAQGNVGVGYVNVLRPKRPFVTSTITFAFGGTLVIPAPVFTTPLVSLPVVAVAAVAVVAAVAAWEWWTYNKKGGEGIGRPKVGVPKGTKPIDQEGWDHDKVEGVKKGVEAGPRDWTGVSPDDHVITGDPAGNAIDHGHWSVYWP